MIVVCSRCGSAMARCPECVARHAYPYECVRGCVTYLPVTADLAALCDRHRPRLENWVTVVARDWDEQELKRRRARRFLARTTRPRRTYARAA
jgi:hypothetical protein